MTTASSVLLDAIAGRHTKDVFVPECKTGPTWGGSPLRLDAWAMKRSWANACTYGYEIKVTRQDFMRDQKWHEYWKYANKFYLVCPHGLIQPSEIEDQIGLLWLSKTGSVLFEKKKAHYRDVPLQQDLAMYILMSRAVIRQEWRVQCGEQGRGDFWKEWLATKIENRKIGHMASRGIKELYERDVDSVRREQVRIDAEVERVSKVTEALQAMGIDLLGYYTPEENAKRIAERLRYLNPERQAAVVRAKDALQEMLNLWREPGQEPDPDEDGETAPINRRMSRRKST